MAAVVGLVHRLVLWLEFGFACTMSAGRRCSRAGIAEYLNNMLWVWRSSRCRRVLVLFLIVSILSLMKWVVKVWAPMGWPRNRAPVFISAFSGLSGESRVRAAWRPSFFCCGRSLSGEQPLVAVRIFVFVRLMSMPIGLPSWEKRLINHSRSSWSRHTEVSSMMEAVFSS